jgi:riboflavin synthase
MFTGIIECMGKITESQKNQGILSLTIESPISHELKPDQSVAHNGICLTITRVDQHTHKVDLIPETLRCSDLSKWEKGKTLNLERCIRADGRWDGHFVYGHVDCCSTVLRVEEISDSARDIYIFCPEEYKKYIIQKGSICVDGVSLTVSKLFPEGFAVSLIPHTLQHTTLSQLKINDKVHLEFDVLAKYVEKILQNRNS